MNKIPRLFLLIFMFIGLSSCVNDDDPSKAWSLPIGSEMPSFDITLSDGTRVTDSDYEGKVAVIVLFNTSCPDCRAELPIVQEVSTMTDSDVSYLCIARQEDNETIARFWSENSLTLPYSPQPDRHVYSLFAESVIPRVMIFNQSGKLSSSFADSPLPNAQKLLETITIASQQ